MIASILLFLGGAVLGLIYGMGATTEHWEKEAIKYKKGQYNPRTGKFEWYE